MARYTGPATRISRRLNVDLVGGDAAFERRPFPPGQHGRARIKQSEYLLQLQEKQKAKYLRSSSATTTRKPPAVTARPVTTCCRSSSPASTTWSTGQVWHAPVAPPASW
jgi:hypothetical protein